MKSVATWPCVVLFGAVLSGACTVGSLDDVDNDPDDPMDDPDDPDDPDEPVVQDYSLSVTPPTQEMTLGTATEFSLSLSSTNYAGPVQLSVTGLPATWSASFAPSPTVSLVENQSATVAMSVIVPSNAEAAAANLRIDATADIGAKQSPASVVVENLLVVPIEAGIGEGAHPFGSVEVRLGATIRFVNYDTELHRIHAGDDDAGFPHEVSPGMAPSDGGGLPGGAYTIDITQAGQYDFYCHEHGQGTGTGLFVVTEGAE